MSAALAPVDVLGGAVRFAGIVELEPTPEGVVLHRMPAWARSQHNDIALSLVETMPSGARLELLTDATCIELDVHLTMVQVGPTGWPAPGFDLVVDGELHEPQTTRTGTLIRVDERTGAVDFESGGPVTMRFDPSGHGGQARRAVVAPQRRRPGRRAPRRRLRPPAATERSPAVGALRQLDLPLP